MVPGPRGADGEPFDPARWEEPRPIHRSKLAAEVTGEWNVHVTGEPGAAPPGAAIYVSELGVSRGALATARQDGSFAVDVVGGDGGMVRVTWLDPAPAEAKLQDRVHQVSHANPSTYLPLAKRAGFDVSTTGSVFHGPAWRFDGDIIETGDEIRLVGTLALRAQTAPPFGVRLEVVPAFSPEGEPSPIYAYAALGRTSTGLPIERMPIAPDHEIVTAPCETGAVCAIDLAVKRVFLPEGGLAVLFSVQMAGGPDEEDYVLDGARNIDPTQTPLALVTHGTRAPMRLAALLFADEPVQAQRGLQARGDEWSWTNRLAFPPETFVLPRTDATGQPIRHLIEPHLPQVLLADRDSPGLPLTRLALPGGSWKVVVRGPDGDTTTLGPIPFEQLTSRTATTSLGSVVDSGGGHVSGLAHPTTLDDTFRHAFPSDGPYTIEVQGWLADERGNKFVLEGAYDILVAEPLDLDLGMLPGTPLAVGRYVDRAVQVHPPFPAEVTFRFRLMSGSQFLLADDSYANASAFGWSHPHAGHPVVPAVPGEYLVSVEARHTDTAGRLWAGSVRFGGVVVDPDDALALRGKRGIDHETPTLDRFARSQTGIAVGGNHFNFPYHPGDVAWQSDDDSMEVRLSLAHGPPPPAVLAASFQHVDTRDTTAPDADAWFREAEARGEAPIFTWTGQQQHAYATVERPGVRVREMVREDYLPNPYWRFDELYGLQPGVGPEGDAPNDYKFLFGGVASYDAGGLRTGGYSALWIDLPEGADSRVGDPFDAPLYDGVRAFYDITGNRPGSTMVVGDTADFGGYVVPLGPYPVFVNVTSPSGKARNLTATADPWGHVHDPALNFMVDEPGVWRVEVALVACRGDVCLRGGLVDGTRAYSVYVADAGASPLPLALPAWLTPAGFDAGVEGASGGHATAWMPGWTLEARPLGPGEPALRYDPAAFARLPNFEQSGFRRGIPPEQVTLSAVAKGPDGLWHAAAVDVWEGRVLPGGPATR